MTGVQTCALPILFSGTIADNLRWGDESADMDQIRAAASAAQAADFVASFPEGYETNLSQGGVNVSGGQKQRLSIARAVYKNAELMIFDDTFSALDYKTDLKVRNNIRERHGDATVVIVAQRIGTIMNADKIAVIDGGKIVGLGTHKELLENCAVYKEIALSQLSEEEL